MSEPALKSILEAALLAAGRPMTFDALESLFTEDDRPPAHADVKAALEELERDWDERGLELKLVSSGYRFQVRQTYAAWMRRLWMDRPTRYSRALLETLAIIAYRQPVTRAEIEEIRGVGVSSSIMKTLLEREWIRILGHREVPGRPGIYGTTKSFLDHFGLRNLESLPPLSEIEDLERIHPDLFADQPPPVPAVKLEHGGESAEDTPDVGGFEDVGSVEDIESADGTETTEDAETSEDAGAVPDAGSQTDSTPLRPGTLVHPSDGSTH
jgi:segregation and condensation protein B